MYIICRKESDGLSIHNIPVYVTPHEDVAKQFCSAAADDLLYNEIAVLASTSIEKNLNVAIPESAPDEEAFQTELTPGNKQWILQALGFEFVGKANVYHQVLGDNRESDTINFDVHSDDIRILPNRIYKKGWHTRDSGAKVIPMFNNTAA